MSLSFGEPWQLVQLLGFSEFCATIRAGLGEKFLGTREARKKSFQPAMGI